MKRFIAILHETANIVKSAGTIFGFIAATYAVGVNYFPNFSVTQILSRWLDPIVAGKNPERFSEGYLYYEIGSDGELTPDGQLVQIPNPLSGAPSQEILADYNMLGVGDYLKSKSEVYLRPAPTTKQAFIRTLGSQECFEIVSLPRELVGDELGTARSGGWIEVIGRPCR